LIGHLPQLTESFRNLDIGLLTYVWPESLANVQKSISMKISELIAQILPAALHLPYRNLRDQLISTAPESLEEFAKKSSLQQDVILTSLEKINSQLCALLI